jgi:hypothetical protein
MQNIKLTHPIRQMFLALAGFVAVIALLESEGLANWADRLEPGPLRSLAAPAADALNGIVQPLGLSALRGRALDIAAQAGWSDDAVRLAHSRKPAALPSVPAATQSGHGPTPRLAAAAVAPLAPGVPRNTTLSPLVPVEQGKPRVVALVGDSMMAVGLSATLMRQAAYDPHLKFVKAFRSGTGLARPDVFNWMDEYPAMVGPEKPDVVIVAIGANDGQGFVVDGNVQLFGTAEWRKTYQSRVADFLAMVESGGARVVWVGLPPMRMDAYNARIAVINRIVYTVVSHDPRATWWNSAAYVADEAGGFREFASLRNGTTVRLRNPDGIHLSDEGAGLMSSVLVNWLDPPLQTALRPSPAAPAPPSVRSAATASAAGTPHPLPGPPYPTAEARPNQTAQNLRVAVRAGRPAGL